MKKTLMLILLTGLLTLTACVPQAAVSPTPLPVENTAVPVETLVPTEEATTAATEAASTAAPTNVDPSADWKSYSNSAFGLSFQYPASWFGPDEYVSEQTLRIAIGSDTVYPYGTDRTEQIYTVPNSYYVTLQYTKDNQNTYWQEDYQSLVNLQDGESISGARSMLIRVRQLKLGRFEGMEYISTLSETAQTEPAYSRQVILFDEQSNLLSIMGTPNHVEISDGAEWREVYQSIDEANVDLFHQIVESITIE